MTAPDPSAKERDLQKVLEITRSMVAASDLDSLLHLIISRSMELLDAERATLFLYDAERDELISRIAHELGEIRMPAGRGIAGACVRSRTVVNVPDAYADDRFNREIDLRTGFRTRNILAVPLRDYGGDLVGVLEVMNKRSGAFGDYDVTLAETLAAQAGVAIQRASLIRHYLQKQRMQRSLEIARDIQRGLLPKRDPKPPGFDVSGFSQPADETGGDMYDFLALPDGRVGIVVADATGHGIGPALVVAETRAMLRALSRQVTDVAAVLERVNDLLTADLEDGRFVTCFLGVLDPARSCITYASAGQGPILFYDARADAFTQRMATGMPLGLFEGAGFEQVVCHEFRPGDLAAILTDGLFEAVNGQGEQFGVDRVLELLRRGRDLPADRTVEALRRAVMEYAGDLPQADDLTAVIIRRT